MEIYLVKVFPYSIQKKILKVGVLNLMGNVFMKKCDDVFKISKSSDDIKAGNKMKLRDIPLGTLINSVELKKIRELNFCGVPVLLENYNEKILT